MNVVKTLLMFNVHGDDNWRHNISGAPELFWPVGILFLLGIVLGLYSLWKSWRRERRCVTTQRTCSRLFALLLTFVWFILALLPAAASDEGIPHALRSILMLPPALIFAALAGVWLYDLIKNHWGGKIAKTLAAIFLVSVAVFAYVDYFVSGREIRTSPALSVRIT